MDKYVNATGLMWETAAEVGGALLVFAEHRYWGKSQPLSDGQPPGRFLFLSAEQALADYARLLTLHIKTRASGLADAKVVVFGGSYGGMLACWMRQLYPDVVVGAIAASAPIAAFVRDVPAQHGVPLGVPLGVHSCSRRSSILPMHAAGWL